MASNANNVDYTRSELSDILPIYEIIQDALAGEETIKSKTSKYLPMPGFCNSVTDKRYTAYITRAVYYNVILPTLEALVGQIFLRPPLVKLPQLLASMEENINGEGLTLPLLVRKAANHVLPFGRGGFLTDFPTVDRDLTLADLESGLYNPFITFYEPWAINNWLVQKVGNQKKLTFLVLTEMYEERENNTYAIVLKKSHRVYNLLNDICTVQVFKEGKEASPVMTLKDNKGQPLTEIPFEFIGSENNDPEIDYPPFYNLATLNIAHYRNSADYEESVFLVGQPTPVYSGLTEDWVNNYFKDGVPFGSRASVPLPENAKAELLQAEPNSMAFEAMCHKEEQMIAIGAKIINPKNSVERKQAEIEIEAASQKSVLTTIKDNLQHALIASLKTACLFVGANPEEIKVELNDNFDLTSMTAEELRYLTELYVSNGISFGEFRDNLRRSGIAKLNDEEAVTAIKGDQAMKKAFAPQPDATKPTVGNPINSKKLTKKVTK